MSSPFHPDYNPLIRKLESVFILTDDERQVLETLPMQVAVLKDRQDIVREGDQPSQSCLILSGFACAYKITRGGSARSSPSPSPVTSPTSRACT
jgi:CRP-like cAMP-binding protein